MIMKISEVLTQMNMFSIVHGDISSSNVLLERENDILQPRLCDFGLAQSSVPREFHINVAVAAPEILTYKHSMEKIDVWALGCLVLRLMLLDSDDKVSWACKAQHEITNTLNATSYSEKFTDFVSGMLTCQPGNRLTASQVLERAAHDFWNQALKVPT
jgi:serine/threonine protein kinase